MFNYIKIHFKYTLRYIKCTVSCLFYTDVKTYFGLFSKDYVLLKRMFANNLIPPRFSFRQKMSNMPQTIPKSSCEGHAPEDPHGGKAIPVCQVWAWV